MVDIRPGAVTLKGTPIDVMGPELKTGTVAPDFILQNNALEDVSLASFAGKTRIIATLPSLDTPVCQAETKQFNDLVKDLAHVELLAVSTDLPFAQKRWCGIEGVTHVTTLSAHRSTDMGEDYGVLISGGPLDRCFARAIFVVNPVGRLAYVEYVTEIAEHPNYDAVLAAATDSGGGAA